MILQIKLMQSTPYLFHHKKLAPAVAGTKNFVIKQQPGNHR